MSRSSESQFSVDCFFFCKQKTAYEMRISDWSSDVCSSDLAPAPFLILRHPVEAHPASRQIGDPGVERAAFEIGGRPPGCSFPDMDRQGDAVRGLEARIAKSGRASCRERVCQYV